MEMTVSELARKLDAELVGDGTAVVCGVAGVRDASAGELAFVSQARYAADAATTGASALIVGRDWSAPVPCPLLKVDKPDRAFAEVARWFAKPEPSFPPGVHPTAVVHPSAKIGEGVHIGPLTVIESGAEIGDRSIINAQCYVGHGVWVGDDCRLFPQVSIREYCRIGNRVWIHNGTVIGSDGFGYDINQDGTRTKQPQIGIVVIGDDVEIGANVTVDRARFGKTRIGKGVKIDNLVQVAHNVVIGDHAVIVAQAGIAGSTTLGAKVIMAGQSGVAGHLTIGAGAIIGAQAGVTKDVPPGTYVIGFPATPQKEAARQHAAVARLPELRERLLALEKRLQAIESKLS